VTTGSTPSGKAPAGIAIIPPPPGRRTDESLEGSMRCCVGGNPTPFQIVSSTGAVRERDLYVTVCASNFGPLC
jgi:hypothetical protein